MRLTGWRLPVLRRLAAPYVQKLALLAILTVAACHVVAAHISLRPAVHTSTVPGLLEPLAFLPPACEWATIRI